MLDGWVVVPWFIYALTKKISRSAVIGWIGWLEAQINL